MQFALGISFPIPGVFYSTGGRPPFIPDEHTPINTNEPYLTVCIQPIVRPWSCDHSSLCASGWTSCLHKRKSRRPSPQVMVMTNKRVSSTFLFSHPSSTYQSVLGAVPADFAHRVCAGLAQLGTFQPSSCCPVECYHHRSSTRRTRHFVDLQFGGLRCWRWEPQPQDAVVLHERRQEPDSIHTHFPRELSIVGRPCSASTCICSSLMLSGVTAHTA